MNLFLADSLNISIQLLFAVLVIVSLLLLGVVLMQRPKQEGLGAAFGAAITDQAFGARTTDVLKKATVYFGTAFMVPQKPLSPPTKGAFFLNTPAAGRRRGVCAPGLFRLLPFREQALK